MLKFIKNICLVIIFSSISLEICHANESRKNDIDILRKSIVTINSRISMSAYNDIGQWTGTGFIVNGDEGYIITNRHVVGRASIGTYFVTFHNGQQAEAKILFADQYADFAILKINTTDLPEDYTVIKFADDKPKLGDEVFIVGNTEGQGFSFHSGYLADLYDINGDMPQGSYIVNMNSTGGASGSPILNNKNEAVAILYGGGKTYAIALNNDYIKHVLKDLSENMTPRRKHIGLISNLTSLDKAVKHRGFSKDLMKEYIKEFPDARNRAITVRSILKGSTAEGKLQPGDIIWKVNGEKVGADLCKFDLIMSKSTDKVKLLIIRSGKEIEEEIDLYDLNDHTIDKMVDFAGGLFFKADDYFSSKSGIPIGSVALANVQTGSSFSNIAETFTQNYKNLYRIKVKALDGIKIDNIDSIIAAINSSIDKKYVSIEYLNYLPYYSHFGQSLVSNQESLVEDITFDSIDNKPRILQYDSETMQWISEQL